MSRYADTIRDDFGRLITGAKVYVYTDEEILAALEEDGGGDLANPVTSDEYGNFYFNVPDGFYILDFFVGGKKVLRQENVAVGGADASFRAIAQDTVNRAVLTVTSGVGQAVSTRGLLAGIVAPANGQSAYLSEPGREGWFTFSSANLSAAVAADASQGLTVAPSSDVTGASGAWVRDRDEGLFVPQWFGATGIGSEELFATSYASDIASSPTTIVQQTADGLAINRAIVALRAAGGGTLYFPKGTYTTYGYLERIDFPCVIEGAGRGQTIIRNCAASPTNVSGYGIFILAPTTLSSISIRGVALDGRVFQRAEPGPGVELRNYPLAIYGSVKVVLDDMESTNSPIDCLVTAYDNNLLSSLQATNCLFSNAFRNTVSTVAGWNQQYTNCIIEKGGVPYGGTNPKYCLDIEPNAFASSSTIKNLTFTNCIFREALNVVAGGIWAGNVRFDACTFQAYGGATVGAGDTASTPWLTNFRGGEFDFSDCTFEFINGTYDGVLSFDVPPGNGDYATTEYIRLSGCTLRGCGINGYGMHMELDDVKVINSLRPLIFGGTGTQNLNINGLTLINVFDPTNRNAGSGAFSSFLVSNAFEGYKDVQGLHIRVDPGQVPAAMLALLTLTTQGYGYFDASTAGAEVEHKIGSVHVAGFYRKLATLVGEAFNTTNFRDWNTPNAPPADTAGQTAGPGAKFYRNCTMYGDAP